LTASAGYGRAERLWEFVERLCLTASAGYGRAERLWEFVEVPRVLTTPRGSRGRALDPFLGTLLLFVGRAKPGTRLLRGETRECSL